jgi:hypothetical protein
MFLSPYTSGSNTWRFYSHSILFLYQHMVIPQRFLSVSILRYSPPLLAQQPLLGQDLYTVKISRSHSDTPHSLGLLWISNQLVAETSTWQHTSHTTEDIHVPGVIRTRNPSKRTAADQHLNPRGHWDRRIKIWLSKFESSKADWCTCQYCCVRYLIWKTLWIYDSTEYVSRGNLNLRKDNNIYSSTLLSTRWQHA